MPTINSALILATKDRLPLVGVDETLAAKANKIRSREPKLTFEQAFDRALKENPGDYTRDAIARGVRQSANESMGQVLSAATQGL